MRIVTILTVALLLGATFLALVPPAAAPGTPLVLNVGDMAEMRTRNVLNSSLSTVSEEDWGVGILQPVYSNPLVEDPVTGVLRPYIAKGVDADGDGIFEAGEYGAFRKDASTNATDITVYFDFNGVRWHDGVQMDVMDLFFSLEVASLAPRYSDPLLPLRDRGGAAGSNFTTDRWLAVDRAPKTWAGEASMPGDPALRMAVRFRLQVPYARFYESTLGGLWLLPRHVWEGTGGGRHADFGRAIYPEGDPRSGRGIPVTETLYKPFDILAALAWEPGDADVVGAGPFRFTTWVSGEYTRLDRYDAYYVGKDPANPAVPFDPGLGAYTHLPTIEGIVFRVYRTSALGVLALQSGEIQYLRPNLPVEFVPDLLNDPHIRIWANAEPGFTYLAYNMRQLPFGYATYPPVNATRDDAGLPFRLAFGHLADKVTMVRAYLLNYGVVADGPVYPGNTFWYNGSLPSDRYDPALAASILDNAGWLDTDGDGWRELPRIGDAEMEILVPQADYDLLRASSGIMLAVAARSAGLNVTVKPTAFGALLRAVENRTFDMALLEAKVAQIDPDFLYPLYHCDGTVPLNDVGYCSPEFNRVVERMRAEMDPTERQRLGKWAQGILMEDRPVEWLYYREQIQATRDFTNWSVDVGTLWNYGSWIGVKLPGPPDHQARVIVSCPSAVASEGLAQVLVTAFDDNLDPLSGANVTLRIVQSDAGTFVESSSPQLTGMTGPAGTFAGTYEAPAVLQPPLDVTIEATVVHPALSTLLQRSCQTTVFPASARFLSLRISLPAGDITFAGSPIPIRIEVTDQLGARAADAVVNATVSPENATLSRSNGTAAEMASLSFSPPAHLGVDQTYRVSVRATKAGYYSAYANVSLLVVPEVSVTPPPPPAPPTALDIALVAGAAVALIAATALILWALRRRRRPRP